MHLLVSVAGLFYPISMRLLMPIQSSDNIWNGWMITDAFSEQNWFPVDKNKQKKTMHFLSNAVYWRQYYSTHLHFWHLKLSAFNSYVGSLGWMIFVFFSHDDDPNPGLTHTHPFEMNIPTIVSSSHLIQLVKATQSKWFNLTLEQ